MEAEGIVIKCKVNLIEEVYVRNQKRATAADYI